MPRMLYSATAALFLATLPAGASDVQSPTSGAMAPPAGYQGQWFTTADGCEYSRAGRPGEEVWYLIINTAHPDCARRIVVKAFADYN